MTRDSKEEKSVWVGRPSQMVNFNIFFFSSSLFLFLLVFGGVNLLLVIPLIYAFWKYMEIRSYIYELTTQRLIIKSGIFVRKTVEVEMYRVRDYVIVQSLFQRLFGVSDVTVKTSDQDNHEVILKSIPDGEKVKDMVRDQVENTGEISKTIREIEVQ
jgi:uncharacterized membrane protein YdbT with pleckstrin-like domain